MPNFRTDQQAPSGEPRPALQLTSTQLVLATCGLLVLGAALILLGMLLKQWEYSLRAGAGQSTPVGAQPITEARGAVPSVRTEEAEPFEGHQITPRPYLPSELESVPTQRPGDREAPRFVEIPAPVTEAEIPLTGPQVARRTTEAERTLREPGIEGRPQPGMASETEGTETPTAGTPTEPAAIHEPEMELLLPSGPEPEPESEKVAPPSVPPGEKKPSPRYTVQVAAIPVGNRDKAEQ